MQAGVRCRNAPAPRTAQTVHRVWLANQFDHASGQRFLQWVLGDTLAPIGGLLASPAKEQPQN